MKVTRTGATLQRLLDANRAFACQGRGTSNHCPMALCALAEMSASPARLQDFFEHWQTHYALPAPPPLDSVRWQNWRDSIGDSTAFSALQAVFAERVQQAGAASVLHEVLGTLPDAFASGAFHPLIRIGYGLRASHASEIGAGLAFWVSDPLLLTPPAERARASSVAQALEHLSQAFSGVDFAGHWITGRLAAVAAHPEFDAALLQAPATVQLLDALAHAALQTYWQTNDFIALHMVTGMHAARTVLAALPAEAAPALLPGLWNAFCAAYVALGAPHLHHASEEDDETEPLDWTPLLAAAVLSDNDHVIKLVHVCWWEAHRPGVDCRYQRRYHAAAARITAERPISSTTT